MNLYKFGQAAAFLGLTPATVNSLVKRGELECIVIAGCRRFYEDALVAYANRVGLRLQSPVNVVPEVELQEDGLPVVA